MKYFIGGLTASGPKGLKEKKYLCNLPDFLNHKTTTHQVTGTKKYGTGVVSQNGHPQHLTNKQQPANLK
ncbi:hypothetical protein GCM10007422_24570 [Pedobacter zeae]|uniref:Uncharacterized protein n=1 Tax=Pedobacter zeae TaxID=1737356 RepID=A0ABQ1XYY1_9SPHI|nr:hypothetical protein GCM10007422_24570 [Pedobacter zeae]